MDHKESYQYRKWCHDNEIKVYLVTEFEYQHRLLIKELNNGTIGKEIYKMRRESTLAATINSKQLHIAVERKKRVSIGEKIFFSDKKNADNVLAHEQVELIYKLIYEKENLAVTT